VSADQNFVSYTAGNVGRGAGSVPVVPGAEALIRTITS
jgi:hypothetical protein